MSTVKESVIKRKRRLLLEKLNARILNNTHKADIDVVFFNRCAKVGSESMLELIMKLESYHELYLERAGLGKKTKRQYKRFEQRQLAKFISDLDEGSFYIEHVNWIDFSEFDLPKPIYINLVRDPIERVISWYYYARGSYKNAIEYKKDPSKPTRSEEWYKKDFNYCVRSGDPECQYVPYTVRDVTGNFKRQSLFFCGHHDDCLPFNTPVAIQMAKEHVERDYAVVGSWEDTNVTLTVLEKYIPRFFEGAHVLFKLHNEKITNRNKNRRKPQIDEDVKEMMRKNFTHEYDFYYFCKQRLYKQYLALNTLDAKKLNNTQKAEIDILFFNRCAKVGSESMMILLRLLGRYNGLTVNYTGAHLPAKRKMTLQEQYDLARSIYQLGEDSIYFQHVNWIDFEQFELPKPIYINLVRDPVERVVSYYYYVRNSYKNAIEYRKYPNRPLKPESWYKKDFNECVLSGDPECQFIPMKVTEDNYNFMRQSLFFCGHQIDCLPFDSPFAVQLAKRHVEAEYAVVGTWEETNITLAVLEKYIPKFFNGAKFLFNVKYDRIRNQNKNNRKPYISDKVKDMIRRNFTNEYDFYYFCRQRLYKQYLAILPQKMSKG